MNFASNRNSTREIDRQTGSESIVAIKIQNKEFPDVDGTNTLVRKEIESLLELSAFPGINRLLSVAEDQTHLYTTIEFLQGGTA